MSSILLVTRKPPPMLMDEMKAAPRANDWAVVAGTRPPEQCLYFSIINDRIPPMRQRAPAAVVPEMAFVTDISGEWRAGVTPQTVWYPEDWNQPKREDTYRQFRTRRTS